MQTTKAVLQFNSAIISATLSNLSTALVQKNQRINLDLSDNKNNHQIIKTEQYNFHNINVVKLKYSENSYRILYDIFDDILLVSVTRIGHRKDVYRDKS